MATKSGRTIAHIKQRSVGSVLLRWESILFLIFLAVNIVNYKSSINIVINSKNRSKTASTYATCCIK